MEQQDPIVRIRELQSQLEVTGLSLNEFRQALADAQFALAQANARNKIKDKEIQHLESTRR